ncbi:ORF1a [Mulberry crinivirus]|nr:ORF1a [Mulberry crinivirus]
MDAYHGSSVSNRTFKGRVSFSPLRPAHLLVSESNKVFLKTFNNYVDKVRLDALKSYFSLNNCNFKKMPKILHRRFGGDLFKISKFIDTLLSSKIGAAPQTGASNGIEMKGLTNFGDGYRMNYDRVHRHIDVFVSFGRAFDYSCELKFRCKLVYNSKIKKNECYVKTAICAEQNAYRLWCADFKLFDRLDNLQFGAQCLLLSVVEKIEWVKLQLHYIPKDCFRYPVVRFRRAINTECHRYRNSLKVQEVKLERKNKVSLGSNADLLRKISTGEIRLPDTLKGRRAGFYSKASRSYSYNGGSHESLGWPVELDQVRSRLGLDASFDHCLIQKFNKDATIGFHRDDEPCYGKNVTVVTLNLKGKAIFKTRENGVVSERMLSDGDVHVMPEGFQSVGEHSVTVLDEGRISLTFRNCILSTKTKIAGESPIMVKSPRRTIVTLMSDKKIGEYFVVEYSSGSVVKILNDRSAVRNLFNATLENGKFIIPDSARTPFGKTYGYFKGQYCWLNAFALANRYIPNFCVPYPALTYAFLLKCGLGKIMSRRITLHKDGTGHFSNEILDKHNPVPRSCYIGVKREDEAPVTMKNIDVFFDDICTGIINQTVVRAENDVMTNIVRRVSDRINDLSRRTKDLKISTSLNSSDKKKITDLFPELNIDFLDTSYSSHALFTAMRECENYVMAKKMGFSDFVDAGGDVVHYIHRNVQNVHVCSPVIDIKDAQRHAVRSNILDKTIGVEENLTMCKKMCQECVIPKQNILAVEVYDMTLEDMAASLLSHRAKRFDFSLIIPPELSESSCDVSLFGGQLKVKCENDRVKYTYGESGESYLHCALNLRRILGVQIFSYKGMLFKKTLEHCRESLCFFSIVQCHDVPNGRYTMISHYRKSEQDKVMMILPTRDRFGVINNVRVKTDRSVVYHLLEYTMNTALRVDDKAIEYLISQFRSRKSVTIKGGKVIQAPFDLPLDLYPGYLGVILGEGIRMRERAHYHAKMSYYKHYLPSLFTIIVAFMSRCFTQLRGLMYKKTVEAMKYVMSESFIQEIVYGDKRIFDIDETYEFTQTVSIVGSEDDRSVLNESFSNFILASQQKLKEIDENLIPISDKFETSDEDVLRELVTSGAGNEDVFEDITHVLRDTFTEETCLVEYSFYQKIYRVISYVFTDSKLIHKFSGFFSRVLRYLIRKGKMVYTSLKSLFLKMISFAKNGCESAVDGTINLVRRCSNFVSGRRFEINNRWVSELESLIDADEEKFNVVVKPHSDTIELTPGEVHCASSDVNSASEDAASRSVVDEDEEFLGRYAECIKEIVLSGGGSYTFRRFLSNQIDNGRHLSNCVKNKFYEFKRRVIALFVRLVAKFRYYPDFVIKFIKEKFFTLRSFIISEDGIEFTVQGFSFAVANVIFHCFVGNFQPASLVFSTVLFVALKVFGIEKRYLGYNIITSQFANILSMWSPLGMLTFPIKSLIAKSVETKVKNKLMQITPIKDVATQVVAKDVLCSKFYSYVDGDFVRKMICVSLLLTLYFPKIVFSFIVCAILMLDQKKYFDSVVYKANVAISYASVIRRNIKSRRLTNFKTILKEKFSRVKSTDEETSMDGDEKIGGRDDDAIDITRTEAVDFDYDGSCVDLPTAKPKWGDEKSGSMTPSDFATLNVSLITPTPQGLPFSSKVRFGLSNVLLKFPMSQTTSYVEIGNAFVDAVREYYYLESQKLCIELGRLDTAVRRFNARNEARRRFQDIVWDMRNQLDDSSLYLSSDGVKWYRLRRGDDGYEKLEGRCKISLSQEIVDFDTPIKGVQLTSDELLGMYTNQRCLGLEGVYADVETLTRIEQPANVLFYNKPPGAGKTTTIVNRLYDDHSKRIKSMALTCTSAGKKEIVEKLQKKGLKAAYNFVTTYDALIMKGSKHNVDTLYCDEIYMVHAGQWLSCLQLISSQNVECYGDINQIPFINRVPNTSCNHGMAVYRTYPVQHDNVSYRCPPDVCYLLSNLEDAAGNKLYPNGVYSAGTNSDILRSMSVEALNSSEDEKYSQKVKHITFTQPEKEEVSRVAGKSIGKSLTANTVNEVQGGTFGHVNLYRLRQYDNPLYQNVNQFVVAVSRHTEKMCYKVVSSKLGDYVSDKICALDNVADFVIKEYKFKQRV